MYNSCITNEQYSVNDCHNFFIKSVQWEEPLNTKRFKCVYKSRPLVNEKLNGSAETLLYSLIDIAYMKGSDFFHVTNKQSAKAIHRSDRTVSRTYRKLELLGYIKIDRKKISDGKKCRSFNYIEICFKKLWEDFGRKLFIDRMPSFIQFIQSMLKTVWQTLCQSDKSSKEDIIKKNNECTDQNPNPVDNSRKLPTVSDFPTIKREDFPLKEKTNALLTNLTRRIQHRNRPKPPKNHLRVDGIQSQSQQLPTNNTSLKERFINNMKKKPFGAYRILNPDKGSTEIPQESSPARNITTDYTEIAKDTDSPLEQALLRLQMSINKS